VGVAVALPLLPPAQLTGVFTELSVKTVEPVMLNVCVLVQPTASETVSV
jgi:hypothetical protein